MPSLVDAIEQAMLRAADAQGLEVSIKAIRPLAEAAARAVEAAAAAKARRRPQPVPVDFRGGS